MIASSGAVRARSRALTSPGLAQYCGSVISAGVTIGQPPHGSAPGRADVPRGRDVVVEALRVVADDPQVRRVEEALREASAELRWNEALRRRWREARAEAAVRGAVASAAVEGVVVPASVLRRAIAERALTRAVSRDPALDAAAGLWRAGVRLTAWMPELRGPSRPTPPSPRALLASLHRDVVGPLAAAGRLGHAEVATPRPEGVAPLETGPGTAPQGSALEDRLGGLLHLLEAPEAPALVRAAVVHGEMLVVRPFSAGNAALGRLLVRHLVTRDGLEPTGVAVPDVYAARAPAAYAQAASAYASGTPEGVVAWVVWQAEALLLGIDQAREICRSVTAGTTAPD